MNSIIEAQLTLKEQQSNMITYPSTIDGIEDWKEVLYYNHLTKPAIFNDILFKNLGMKVSRPESRIKVLLPWELPETEDIFNENGTLKSSIRTIKKMTREEIIEKYGDII